ncbi:PTS sugar transporter subunit IIC [Maledivibacter halophilus]|uniref:Permease IIC component n=1 Tax=Maledivibacter halophilus TaxID=36842 RepID=A0A1T5KCG8_9FIRM|nr:PTS sugar transporter subunit IIC [Maledivibacter halophilus]SKC61381.1 PTS system, cellobiose-specific IIC component [Maledivibacter halophilus]
MNNKVTELLENKLMPIAVKMNQNRYLASIRDGFLVSVPFIIFGSICVIVPNLPYLNKIIGDSGVENIGSYLGHASLITMNLTALIIAFSIAYNLGRRYEVNSLYAGFISLMSFFMITPFSLTVEGKVIDGIIPMQYMGAQGMFVAMITSILATEIFRFVIKKGWTIKMPNGVPKAVTESFSSLIPLIITLISFFIIKIVFQYTGWGNAHEFIYKVLQTPLMGLGNNLFSVLIATTFIQLFWFFGLHGTIIVYSVIDPIWMSLSQQNFDAINAGGEAVNIINKQFIEVFYNGLGGPGGIIAVTIILLFIAKSKQLKQLGKLAAPADLFNVMETVVFGLPVVMNPIVLIPFILCPLVTNIITYFSMKLGLVPIAHIAIPWTVPPILSGILATESIAGGILQLINIVVAILIWLPFVLILDKQKLELEKKQENK